MILMGQFMMVTALWTSIYTVFANIRRIKFAPFQLSAVLLHAIGGWSLQ